MTFVRPFKPNLGDGSDSNPASSSFTVVKQVYQWTEYTLQSGHTITLSANYKPSIFRCQGTLTIEGTINGDGKGWQGGAGASQGNTAGGSGYGPGGGIGGWGYHDASTGGGGGGALGPGATNGGGESGSGDWRRAGTPYDPIGEILTGIFSSAFAGSGGGGGGVENGEGGHAGNGSSGGGGAAFIARKIVLGATASILLRGIQGTGSTWGGNGGGGGGGSGGPCLFMAEVIELPDSGIVVTATGGNGGPGSGWGGSGGRGGDGRIYLVPLRKLIGDAAGRCNPAATVIDLSKYKTTLG
jgi:hypothetical protein